MASVMRQFLDNSYLFGGNAPFIEDLYEKYLINPQSVPDEWRDYFDRLQVLPGNAVKDIARAPVEESFVQRAKRGELGGAARTYPTEPVAPERGMPQLTNEQRLHLLQKLTEAEHLERYLHTRYVGQKRFSLEGGESLIPCIDELIQRAGGSGVQEFVIGMAHRGRLNVLVNVLGKMPKDLFLEFEGKAPSELPSGDVKYHNGFSSDLTTSGGPVHISLAFNPSHLEIVNPVVEGSVRARQ